MSPACSRPSKASYGYGRYALDTHSQTFPARSSAPVGEAPRGCFPTGDGPPIPAEKMQRSESGGWLPHGQSRSSPPLAPASHSASVGRRVPDHAQNSCASCHETYVTGHSSCPAASDLENGSRRPVSTANARYCRFVTGVRLIRNAASRTKCRGSSSGSGGYAASGSLPIMNGPAGTTRHSMVELPSLVTPRSSIAMSRDASPQHPRRADTSSLTPLNPPFGATSTAMAVARVSGRSVNRPSSGCGFPRHQCCCSSAPACSVLSLRHVPRIRLRIGRLESATCGSDLLGVAASFNVFVEHDYGASAVDVRGVPAPEATSR